MSNFVTELTCVVCGRASPPPASAGTCTFCADPFAVLDVQYDMDTVRSSITRQPLAGRPPTLWRYHELLPIEPDPIAFAWPVGFTPIIEAPRLAEWAGVSRLRLKDDSRNPTASFKDRASSVGVLHALQQGADTIACASTGNAASSLAGFAAMAGLPAVIFVPQRAPDPKVAQLLMFGADVRRVRGTYAQAYELCTAECESHAWYNRNCAINPYLVEGKKTCGLEIAEQTAGDLPDWVVVSVGDGCTIAGIAKGLRQMHQLGLIDRVPRVLGVQADGMAPVAEAFESGKLTPEFQGDTFADSIDVPVPRNWRKAVAAVRDADGAFVRVTDEQTTEAMKSAGALSGVFAEPAAAASVAGVKQATAEGIFSPRTDALAVITGSGLKDVAAAMRVVGQPTEVEPLES
jgi:threonine synthase